MYEYRIMAYFSEVEPDRSYKRKIFRTYEDAQKVLEEARSYYFSPSFKNRTLKVVIERRKVSGWEEVKADG